MEDYLFKLKPYLNEFQKLEKKFENGVPHSISLDYKKHLGHIVFSGLIHGNEVGSLPALLKSIDDLLSNKLKYGGKVTFFLGNIDAALKNVRYLEADLNRSFGNKNSMQKSMERKRALEIMPLLNRADVYFDFHQTIMPCLKPFYIFEMNEQSYYWARAAGVAQTFVTRKKGSSFSAAGMCSDEYVRSLGKVGVTIELSEKGFSQESENICYNIIKRSLFLMDKVYGNKFSIKKLSHKNGDFEFFSVIHREPFSSPATKLKEGLANFNKVTKGMDLGWKDSQKTMISPKNGYILFPKYPTRNSEGNAIPPLPGEIFVLADKIKEHPLLWE
ncbi:succinylglutamate desuccinylase/aspartoacylase domain-containing protein [Silvanigrella aquatica]|uniref:Succinylglutamate desuccinylase/Aspartoacylase catalytic domain-containing protein n=1 Tax=Silvanigrella aquatica TaxID=1915309 RepID=A0A1L4D0N3_9BACT|nr:succinylglutamate desuccinylase/aspartoacylase family protein [Silvanigrella aquatica]APJ03773.1 hypothetical protein AXG55_07580 [Silvanigrella aquatica]